MQLTICYVERDLRQMLNVRELATFQRFLRMCAARVGQLLNLSSFANDRGITHNTARTWLSVLEASYLIYLLQPHFRNFGKRLVKTPKLYFHDPGLAAWLLHIQDPAHLSVHPQRGGLFECLVAGELLKARYHRGLTSNLYFWRSSTGDEVDMIVDRGDRLSPVEIKSGLTLNADLFRGLDRWRSIAGSTQGGCLVYGGNESLQRGETRIISWRDIDAEGLVGG
jgi:hypothetical protein